jgi:DNA-binding transcriptional LysR family regulator
MLGFAAVQRHATTLQTRIANMQTIDDLNDLRFVAAVSEAGSLAAAARRLGVNHATVFRRLLGVEAALGVRLFERARGRYTPTPAGEELARAGAAIEREAAQSLRKVAGQDLRPAGVVRVTTTDTLHAGFVAAMARTCRRRFPEISLHVTATNQVHDLSKRDADIAIRPVGKPPGHLIGKRIGPLAMAAYAARRLRRDRASADEPAWIGLDDSLSYHRSLKWLAGQVSPDALAYRTNSFAALQDACAAGLGQALLPCFAADADTRLRRLTPPLPELGVDLWLLMHPDLRRTARVMEVFELLAEEFRSVAPRLAGELPPAPRARAVGRAVQSSA